MPSANPTPAPSDLAWRVIGLTNLYRLLLPPVLLILQGLASPGILAPAQEPELFQVVCYAYLVAGRAADSGAPGAAAQPAHPRAGERHGRHPGHLPHSVYLRRRRQRLGDPAGAARWAPWRCSAGTKDAFLVPAIATLGLLTQQIAANLVGYAPPTDFTTAGMLGVVLFVIGLSVWPIADRLRESEALVQAPGNRPRQPRAALPLHRPAPAREHPGRGYRGPDSPDQRIRGGPAGRAQAFPGALLGEASPRLLYLLEIWRQRTDGVNSTTETLVSADGARMLRPHFAALGNAEPAAVLVFLEDMSLIAEKAQQLKLAALGRLSASIAHEIRNPVGAMSHAGQLLGESPQLAPEDQRLTDIITKNAERVSDIINNVLQLSRRESTQMETIELASWIEDFRDEFCETMQWRPDRLVSINVETSPPRPPGRSRRWRCARSRDGANRRSCAAWKSPPIPASCARWCGTCVTTPSSTACATARRMSLKSATVGSNPRRGPSWKWPIAAPACAPEDAERIFEPFFSGEHQGSGLGLFLARELAQTSGATLAV